MFKTILVPTDGSPLSRQAAAGAIALAQDCGAALVAMSVWQSYPYSPYVEFGAVLDVASYGEQMRQLAVQCVQEVASAAALAGVRCDTHVAPSFCPYEEILAAAELFHCDLIYMASHGRKGLEKFLLGSQTQLVLAHSVVPVLVHR